jgi:CheY-like chemotaxis protein
LQTSAAVKFTLSTGNDVVNQVSARILALLELTENSHQVVESLTLSGHNVIACDTFTKAVAILQQPHTIDMIISDVHLENGGNVFDFLRWLKVNSVANGTLLVLFSFRPTALAKHLEDGIRTSARMLGVAMYITMNSFDSDEFRKQIDSLLPEGEKATELSPSKGKR